MRWLSQPILKQRETDCNNREPAEVSSAAPLRNERVRMRQ
jgi:hypothetical protein